MKNQLKRIITRQALTSIIDKVSFCFKWYHKVYLHFHAIAQAAREVYILLKMENINVQTVSGCSNLFHRDKRKRFIKSIFVIAIIVLYFQNSYSQVSANLERGYLRVMFYNVENLFDTVDDSLTQDEEFLPGGERFWTNYRYQDKLNNLFKVIIAVGGWEPPEIIGLCEVENRKVIEDLLKETPLSKYDYKIVHNDSPDKRGIDVALLYLPNSFTILNTKSLPVTSPGEPDWKTRDILYVMGTTASHDSLHLFINHWPSRSGGQLETEKYRMNAAHVLKRETDRTFLFDPEAKIIIMGDFNDNPDDKSLHSVLKVKMDLTQIKSEHLYNLSKKGIDRKVSGSHKYLMGWALMDQIIVSGSLLETHVGLIVREEDFHIFSPKFLLEPDETYLGVKPFRTYSGFKYQNGFSDHLPVFIDLWNRIPEN